MFGLLSSDLVDFQRLRLELSAVTCLDGQWDEQGRAVLSCRSVFKPQRCEVPSPRGCVLGGQFWRVVSDTV